MADPIIIGTGDDWEIARGDTVVLELDWVEPDDAETPIDLDAVAHALRVHVKRHPDDVNAEAVLRVGSYDGSDYVIGGASSNRAQVTIQPHRTRDLDSGRYFTDAELTRAGAPVTSAGTIALTAGSGDAVGTGVDFTGVEVGDLLVPAGVEDGNDVPVVVTAVSGDTISTDYQGFSTEAAVSFTVFRGQVDTAFTVDAVVSDDRTR